MNGTANRTGQESQSLWTATADAPAVFPALDHNLDCDVVVIGGGYTGLNASLTLEERGSSSVVLEAHQPGWGASGRNGGQVIPGLHPGPDALARRYGRDRGEAWLRLALTSADLLFATIAEHGIDCDQLHTGHLKLAHAPWALPGLAATIQALEPYGARMRMLDRAEAVALSGSHAYCGGRLTENGGAVHPLKLVHGLARSAASWGVRIFGGTPATGFRLHDGKWRVATPGGTVTAHGLLLATNTHTERLHRSARRGQVRVRSFQAATAPLGSRGDHVLPEGQAAADTRRLLHYFRTSPDGCLIMGGRAPFKHDVTLDDTGPLRRGIATIYPEFADEPLEICWGGWVGMTLSDLPVLARIGPRAYAVYGFNGTGVALSCLMGREAAKLAAGASEDETAVPVEKASAVPFHRLSGIGARAWIMGLGLMDRFGL